MIILQKYIPKIIFITLFSLSSLTVIYGAENVIISDISLSGLKRTKESVVYQILKPVEVGSIFTEETEETIVQKLRETGIFVPEIKVNTEVINNEAFISIEVNDRWTLIPIPIFSISNDGSWNAGVLAIENNFIGFYKTLGLGFFYGSEGWTLISFYNDPLFFNSDFIFTAGFSAGLDEIEEVDVYEDILREYQTDKIGVSLSLGYPLTENLNLTGGVRYDRSILRSGSNSSLNLKDLNTLAVNSEIEWKDVYYDIPYEKGLSINISPSWNWGFDQTSDYPAIDGSFEWTFTPWLNHLIILNISGGQGELPVQELYNLGGTTGTRVLPMSKIYSDEYVSSAAIYNVPLWFFKWGTLSSKVFYEVGYYKSDLIDRTLFHGPGLGLELFINNLAIPAVGINLGWNLETEKMQFSAGIGM